MYLQSKASSECLLLSTGIRIVRQGVAHVSSSAIFKEENPQKSSKSSKYCTPLLITTSTRISVERLIYDVLHTGEGGGSVTWLLRP